MIRGWHPVLISGRIGGNVQTDRLLFDPQGSFEFADDSGTNDGRIKPGGWSIWIYTLEALYQEHTDYRNRWSASNCGFDICRYFGTRLTFVPHLEFDYLVYVETDYRNSEHFKKQWLHPAVLVTHPNARIIWSYKRRRYYKLPHMWVPRPSMWPDGWMDMKDASNSGMFYIFVSWIDFHRPWLADGHSQESNAYNSLDDGQKKYMWWAPHLPGQENYIPNPASDRKGKHDWLTHWGDRISNPGDHWSNYGPFVLKNGTGYYPQICMFYKSYWMWGGNTLRLKKICDPSKEPKYAYDPPERTES